MSLANSIMQEKETQVSGEHWFRKYAKTIPAQHLPAAVVGAIRGTVFAYESTKTKMRRIREFIEIYDELEGRNGGKSDL